MPLKGLAGGLYKPLSRDDITAIHETSLTILENIGMTYESGLDETLAVLENSGLKIDRDKSRIYFDRQLVNAQAAAAPMKASPASSRAPTCLISIRVRYSVASSFTKTRKSTRSAAVK